MLVKLIGNSRELRLDSGKRGIGTGVRPVGYFGSSARDCRASLSARRTAELNPGVPRAVADLRGCEFFVRWALLPVAAPFDGQLWPSYKRYGERSHKFTSSEAPAIRREASGKPGQNHHEATFNYDFGRKTVQIAGVLSWPNPTANSNSRFQPIHWRVTLAISTKISSSDWRVRLRVL